MASRVATEPTGHVYRREGKRGAVWYAKYRLPDGRQVQKRLGPAWSGRTPPSAGYVTKRAAEKWLADALADARRGTLPGLVRTGATVADAAAEYLRYIEHDRGRKPSTVIGYRWIIDGQILPVLGTRRLEDVTSAEIEAWLRSLDVKPSSRRKALVILHGVFQRARKVHGLTANPASDVEKPPLTRSGDIEVFSPEEVSALAGAADSQQDAAIFLTAAFTGLRMGELLALHWRDLDFAGEAVRVRGSYSAGHLTTPKSGKVRSVPLAPDVANTLARLGDRERFTGNEDLVFASERGDYLDGSALRRRYIAALGRAGLRRLRFHDLRHTFGTRMIAYADSRPGMDGTRRHPDPHEVSALRPTSRGCRARRTGLRSERPDRGARSRTGTASARSSLKVAVERWSSRPSTELPIDRASGLLARAGILSTPSRWPTAWLAFRRRATMTRDASI